MLMNTWLFWILVAAHTTECFRNCFSSDSEKFCEIYYRLLFLLFFYLIYTLLGYVKGQMLLATNLIVLLVAYIVCLILPQSIINLVESLPKMLSSQNIKHTKDFMRRPFRTRIAAEVPETRNHRGFRFMLEHANIFYNHTLPGSEFDPETGKTSLTKEFLDIARNLSIIFSNGAAKFIDKN